MKIVSVSVGLPREVDWKGKTVTTGIFKEPVNSHVMMRTLNLDGDGQADLSVHGGPSKAVYVYPSEHYACWRDELLDTPLSWGSFGENLTVEGMREEEINIGDRFRIGTTEVMVTEPRMPCYKLAIRLGRDDIVKRFLQSGRSGFYFAVLREGEVGAGDSIEPLSRDQANVAVTDIWRLYAKERDNLELMRRAVQVGALPDGWREYILHRIEKLET